MLLTIRLDLDRNEKKQNQKQYVFEKILIIKSYNVISIHFEVYSHIVFFFIHQSKNINCIILLKYKFNKIGVYNTEISIYMSKNFKIFCLKFDG